MRKEERTMEITLRQIGISIRRRVVPILNRILDIKIRITFPRITFVRILIIYVVFLVLVVIVAIILSDPGTDLGIDPLELWRRQWKDQDPVERWRNYQKLLKEYKSGLSPE